MAEITLQEAVRNFANQLAQKVDTFISDITEMEVRTFTTPADQVETFVKANASFADILTEGKAALRAYTKIDFDGDTTIWLPTNEAGEVDSAVWEVHQSVVARAIADRATMIQSLGVAATAALTALDKARAVGSNES